MKIEWLSRSAHWMLPGSTLIAVRSGDVYGNVIIANKKRREKGFVKTSLLEMVDAMKRYKAEKERENAAGKR